MNKTRINIVIFCIFLILFPFLSSCISFSNLKTPFKNTNNIPFPATATSSSQVFPAANAELYVQSPYNLTAGVQNTPINNSFDTANLEIEKEGSPYANESLTPLGTFNATYSFEDDVAGGLAADFTYSGTGTAVVEASYLGHQQVLHVTQPNAANYDVITNFTAGQTVFSAWVCPVTNNYYNVWKLVRASDGASIAALTFNPTGDIYASNGGGWIDVGTCAVNRWFYTAFAEIDYTSKTYAAYVDGYRTGGIGFNTTTGTMQVTSSQFLMNQAEGYYDALQIGGNVTNAINQGEVGVYNSTFSFESDTPFTVPSGWTDASGAGCRTYVAPQVSTQASGHRNVLCLDDQNTTTKCKLNYTFPAIVTSGTVEYWMLSTNMSKVSGSQFILYDNTYIAAICNLYTSGATLHASAVADITLMTITSNVWYHVRVQFNTIASVFSVWVNGLMVSSNQAGSAAPNVYRISIDSGSSTQTGFQTYLDAIDFSPDPAYFAGRNIYLLCNKTQTFPSPGSYSFRYQAWTNGVNYDQTWTPFVVKDNAQLLSSASRATLWTFADLSSSPAWSSVYASNFATETYTLTASSGQYQWLTGYGTSIYAANFATENYTLATSSGLTQWFNGGYGTAMYTADFGTEAYTLTGNSTPDIMKQQTVNQDTFDDEAYPSYTAGTFVAVVLQNYDPGARSWSYFGFPTFPYLSAGTSRMTFSAAVHENLDLVLGATLYSCEPFDEGSLCWNNHPAPTSGSLSVQVVAPVNSWNTWSISSTIKQYVMLKGSGNFHVSFYALNHGIQTYYAYRNATTTNCYRTAGLCYIQTNITENLNLTSPVFAPKSVVANDRMYFTYNTTGSGLYVQLLNGGVIQQTYPLSATVDVTAPCTFDQIRTYGSFDDTENLQVTSIVVKPALFTQKLTQMPTYLYEQSNAIETMNVTSPVLASKSVVTYDRMYFSYTGTATSLYVYLLNGGIIQQTYTLAATVDITAPCTFTQIRIVGTFSSTKTLQITAINVKPATYTQKLVQTASYVLSQTNAVETLTLDSPNTLALSINTSCRVTLSYLYNTTHAVYMNLKQSGVTKQSYTVIAEGGLSTTVFSVTGTNTVTQFEFVGVFSTSAFRLLSILVERVTYTAPVYTYYLNAMEGRFISLPVSTYFLQIFPCPTTGETLLAQNVTAASYTLNTLPYSPYSGSERQINIFDGTNRLLLFESFRVVVNRTLNGITSSVNVIYPHYISTNRFFADDNSYYNCTVYDLFGQLLYNVTNAGITSFIDIVISGIYSVKIQNQMRYASEITLTRNNSYSQFLASNEITEYQLFAGSYELNYTNAELGTNVSDTLVVSAPMLYVLNTSYHSVYISAYSADAPNIPLDSFRLFIDGVQYFWGWNELLADSYAFVVKDWFDANVYAAMRSISDASPVNLPLSIYSLKVQNLMRNDTYIRLNSPGGYLEKYLLAGTETEIFIGTGTYQLFYTQTETNTPVTYNFVFTGAMRYVINTSYSSIYISAFSNDGQGVPADSVRLYLDYVRVGWGLVQILGPIHNITVLDYFNDTMFSQVLDISNYSEFSVFVNIAWMSIYNNNTAEYYTFSIVKNNTMLLTQAVAPQNFLLFRFTVGTYNVTAFYQNGTLFESHNITLLENSSNLLSFGTIAPDWTALYASQLYNYALFKNLTAWSPNLADDYAMFYPVEIMNYLNTTGTVYFEYMGFITSITVSANQPYLQPLYVPRNATYRLFDNGTAAYLTAWTPVTANVTAADYVVLNFGFFQEQVLPNPELVGSSVIDVIVIIVIFLIAAIIAFVSFRNPAPRNPLQAAMKQTKIIIPGESGNPIIDHIRYRKKQGEKK